MNIAPDTNATPPAENQRHPRCRRRRRPTDLLAFCRRITAPPKPAAEQPPAEVAAVNLPARAACSADFRAAFARRPSHLRAQEERRYGVRKRTSKRPR